METVNLPKWFWALIVGFAAWMSHQTVETRAIRASQQTIIAEHDRRILKLEDRVDELTDRIFRVEADKN